MAELEATWAGEVWEWRGPAPHHFVTVPSDVAESVADIAPQLTYGWGMVPATVRIGGTTETTSLFPREGGYVVPLKAALRRAEDVAVGDVVELHLSIGGRP